MFAGFAVLSLQHLHANMRRQLPEAVAGLSECVRASQVGLRATHEPVWLRVAREDEVRRIAGVWRQGQPVHGLQHIQLSDNNSKTGHATASRRRKPKSTRITVRTRQQQSQPDTRYG